eukprot:gene2103-1970_t
MSTKELNSIFDNLGANVHWTSLDLTKSNLGTNGIEKMGISLKKNTHLKGLILNQTNIKKGIQTFSKSLFENTSLVKLELQNNSITDEEFSHLTKAIESHDTLRIVTFNTNSIEDCPGLKKLLEMNKISELHLSKNQIYPDALCEIFKSIEGNNSLNSFSLSDNGRTLKYMDVLANSLRVNKSLTSLNLSKNVSTGNIFN